MKAKLVLVALCYMQFVCGQSKNEELLQTLSIEEKIKIVVGAGMDLSAITGEVPVVGKTEEKVPGAAGTSNLNEKIGLPQIVFSDGPAGVRINPVRKNEPGKTFYATAFPVATLMASTFNTEMLEITGKAFGNECKAYGVDFLLAPALNIHRNPLGGRNFEYYSEDPVVSGKMAAAFTRGVQSQGVGVSLKHFAANNQETNRAQVNTIVSERVLREIYLKGFEIAVKESDPWTIMSSYNKINDVYTSESFPLLTTILRDEWGFKGFVMTDWFGGTNPVAQMIAGNDLLMPGSPKQEEAILNAINSGSLSINDLNRNVLRILNVYAKTLSMTNQKPTNNPDFEHNRQISRQAASEGMVLLMNQNNTLPIDLKSSQIALFGIGSYMTIAGGTGSGDVNKAYTISVAEGLKNIGFKLESTVENAFNQYINQQKALKKPKAYFFLPDVPFDEFDWTDDQLATIVNASTIGIFTLSRTSGEFFDRKVDDDFNLKASELQLIEKLSKAFHKQNKPFVILLNIGGVVETASWKNLADAILLMWQPGQEGGNAVAEILSGKINPSGRLPMTFPVKYTDVISSSSFPGIVLDTTPAKNIMFGRSSEVVYHEDIFVGYRYYSTYGIKPSFPFGYGLSYSQFSISDLSARLLANGNIKISCLVTNIGKVAGKEVVQIYASAPKSQLKKPSKELKAFAKTRDLQPGEKQEFEFNITPYELSSFDPESSSWILDKGEYTFFAVKNVDENTIAGTINIPETVTILKTNKVLTSSRIIEQMP